MNAGQSGKVDLDLLADYVGGALDGTVEERAVARLIAEDAHWAQAYARLARDSDEVRQTLAEWGAEPAPMPPDVVARLSAGLAAAGSRARAAEPRDDPTAPGTRPAATRPPGRTDADSARPAGRRTRRRLPGWATPVAVAAALAAVVGLGVSQLVGGGDIAGTSAGTFSSRDAAAPAGAEGGAAAQPPAEPSPGQVLASGTDYTRSSLVDRVGPLAQTRASASSLTGKGSAPKPDQAGGDQFRGDLTDRRNTLAACLRAIADEHGRGTPRFEVVDYARFEGQPALIVVFADIDGHRWAWAVGPECGQPQAGAAARYAARVG